MRRSALGVGLLSFTVGCTMVAETARPKAPTAETALDAPLGAACESVGQRGTPLIVDLGAAARMDLEEAMMSGVVAVKYTCDGLEFVSDCHIPGNYAFMPFNRKAERVRLDDANQVRLNLPITGGALVEGGVGTRSRLDLDTVLIGKRSTTVRAVDAGSLDQPSCARATHFLRGAYVGAFTMHTATRGDAAASAEVVGRGAHYEGTSARTAVSQDGDFAACTPSLDSKEPPANCSALLRVELLTISPAHAVAEQPADGEVELEARLSPCPHGTVQVDYKCAARAAANEKPYVCEVGKLEECQTQCDRGSTASCSRLGYMYEKGLSVARDVEKGRQLYEKACSAGEPHGCAGLGYVLLAVDRTEDLARVASLNQTACDGGIARGCSNLGVQAKSGQGAPKDWTKAAKLFERACAGGFAVGCANLAAMVEYGESVPQDSTRAAELYQRSCEGDFGRGCGHLGRMLRHGKGVTRDEVRGVQLLAQACASGYEVVGDQGVVEYECPKEGAPIETSCLCDPNDPLCSCF